MRFYPTGDVNHYWEFAPEWSHYCHYMPHKSWHRKPLTAKHTIAYWRDSEGAARPRVTQKDFYIKDWPLTRRHSEACLPQYYCVGNRFIRLEKAYPVGFKCATMPMNLKEVRNLKKALKKMRRAKAKEAQQLHKKKIQTKTVKS